MASSTQFKFSTVTGFFLQDEPNTDAITFDYVRAFIDLQTKRSPY